MQKELLTILKDARLKQPTEEMYLDYKELFHLSTIHNVGALVFNQIYSFEQFPNDLKEYWG